MNDSHNHTWNDGNYLFKAVQFIYAPDNTSIHWLYQELKNTIHVVATGAILTQPTCYRLAEQIARELNDPLGDFIRSRYAPASTVASIILEGAAIEQKQHPNGWGK